MPSKVDLLKTLDNFLKPLDFPSKCKVAAAVSGGPDSLALAFALKSLEKKYGYILYAIHINHKLRKEADSEAQSVSNWLGKAGIPCIISSWKHSEIKTKIQEQARNARYELLSNACHEKGIKAVFLAHHKEDLYETVLYRLSCGTGMDGLAGIPPVSIKAAVPFLRPLLSVHKKDLVAYLDGHPYVQDPSNHDTTYTRVKFRQATEYLSSLGLTVEKITEVSEKAKQNRLLVEEMVNNITPHYVKINSLGYALLNPALLQEVNPEIQYRILESILMKIGGNTSPLRQKNLKEFIEKNRKNTTFKGDSIGNCLVRPYQKKWLIIREPEKIMDTQPVTKKVFWDNRFLITGLKKNQNLFIGALGKNWAKHKDFFDDLDTLPSYFWQTIPVIYDRNERVLEILVQSNKSSDTLGQNYSIEFSPYCTQYKSIFNLNKRIPL